MSNKYIELDTKVIKKTYSIFKQNYSIQDVNILCIKDDFFIYNDIINSLGINIKNIKEIVPCRFLSSIAPHHDRHYAKSNGITKSAIVILKKGSNSSKYPDNIDASYLFTNKKFIELKENKAYRFNICAEHALMNECILDSLIIFYTGNDNFTKTL